MVPAHRRLAWLSAGRYASMAAVPDSNFNANSTKAAQKWKIVATGTTYTMTQTIMSNETAAYRAVPVTAR